MPTGAPKGMGKAHAYALPGFDREAFEQSEIFLEAQKSRMINKKFPEEPMHPELLAYYESIGCRKELFDTERDYGLYQYSVFTPLEIAPDEKLPMLYISHGGGGNNYGAEGFGFNQMIAKERFICVYANNGGKSNEEVETEFKRILEELLEKGYPIDQERIYAAGFSAGADASGVLASAWPELIAGTAPLPGGNVFEKGGHYANPENYAKNLDLQVPLICIGGTMDGGDRYPLQTETACQNFNIWMKTIVKAVDFTEINMLLRDELLQNGNAVEKVFGLKFHKTWEEDINGLHYYCGEYYGAKGNACARFMCAEGIPHMLPTNSPHLVWEFLRHFRRDLKTKEIIYTQD